MKIRSILLCLVLLGAAPACTNSHANPKPVSAIDLDRWLSELTTYSDLETIVYVPRRPDTGVHTWDMINDPTFVFDLSKSLKPAGEIAEITEDSLFLADLNNLWRVDLNTRETTDAGDQLLLRYPVRTSPDRLLGVRQDRTLISWESLEDVEYEELTADGAFFYSPLYSSDPLDWNDDYYLTRYFVNENRQIADLDDAVGVQVEAWLANGKKLSQPAISRTFDGTGITWASMTDDNRVLLTEDDLLHVWNLETDEVETFDNPAASDSVFVLANGIIVTSGQPYELGQPQPNPESVTRFWDPDTMEEIMAIEGLTIYHVAPLTNNRVAFAVGIANPEQMRGEDATNYRIEIWDLDQTTNPPTS